jgi:hypothetical protein
MLGNDSSSFWFCYISMKCNWYCNSATYFFDSFQYHILSWIVYLPLDGMVLGMRYFFTVLTVFAVQTCVCVCVCVCLYTSLTEVNYMFTHPRTEEPKNTEVLFPLPRYVYLVKCVHLLRHTYWRNFVKTSVYRYRAYVCVSVCGHTPWYQIS